MIREENDFRISVAGAQEKTALLRIGNDWCIPKGITPTTHIIKLPIGEIRQPNATLDLSQSVDNEYYCLLLAKELGLNVPDAEIIKAGNVRALAVERFDRRWNAERTVLLRLPQEDMCQTFGLPSSVKYESDGGPGIARIPTFQDNLDASPHGAGGDGVADDVVGVDVHLDAHVALDARDRIDDDATAGVVELEAVGGFDTHGKVSRS